MIKNILPATFLLIIIFIFPLFLTSCYTTKHIKYFEDIPDSGQVKTLKEAEYTEPKIQVDDIMTILVQTVDPLATVSINAGNVPSASSGVSASSTAAASIATTTPIAGYLVGKDGNVEIPILGKMHLEGLTTSEARQLVQKKAQDFFKDPSVIVRYANFKIVVAGEVLRPSSYIVPNEKVTILEALALAGDLTIYGKRENILLLRDNLDGTKIAYRVNLNKSGLLNQPFYYLHQNDYIYVEPTKGKVAANDISQAKTFAIFSSILSVLIIIATRVK